MGAIGIVVRMGDYTATVHLRSCKLFLASYHHNERVPIPRSAKVKVCQVCKPSRLEIEAGAKEAWWDEGHDRDAWSTVVSRDLELVEAYSELRRAGRPEHGQYFNIRDDDAR